MKIIMKIMKMKMRKIHSKSQNKIKLLTNNKKLIPETRKKKKRIAQFQNKIKNKRNYKKRGREKIKFSQVAAFSNVKLCKILKFGIAQMKKLRISIL